MLELAKSSDAVAFLPPVAGGGEMAEAEEEPTALPAGMHQGILHRPRCRQPLAPTKVPLGPVEGASDASLRGRPVIVVVGHVREE